MIPTRYDIYYERCAIDKKNNGDYVLYADAEKWVKEEIEKKDEGIAKTCEELEKQIVALSAETWRLTF